MSEESGQTGSGGRKQSWRETTGKAERPDEPKAEQDKTTAKSMGDARFQTLGPRRFRGGTRAVQRRGSEEPAWLRVFLPATALFLTLAALVAVLLWIIPRTGVKPLLVAWAVTDYDSPVIPPNDFAYHDVQKMQQTELFAKGQWQDTTNLQTEQNFEIFFDRELAQVESDTLVVYLSAHGVSDENAAFLLHSEATAEPASGFPLTRVLDRMAECPARYKLLILDATRIDANLDLGLLGNDFVHHLKRDYEALASRLADEEGKATQNFWVLCSSDEGQVAWASRSLKHSVFGLTVAYCLRGGGDADLPDERDEKDGLIFASELVKYVTERVSSWAPKYREAVQKPVVLNTIARDQDFPLIEVDPELTAADLLREEPPAVEEEEPEPEKAEPEEKTEEPKPEKPKEEEKPAKPIAEAIAKREGARFYGNTTFMKESPRGALSAEDLANQLNGFWNVRDQLAQSELTVRRPDHWHKYQQRLLRAERLLLAGELDSSVLIVSEPVPKLARDLALPSGWPTPRPWSLAFLDPAIKDESLDVAKEEIDGFLATPIDQKLAPLANSRLVEADLLRILAQTCRNGNRWNDADAVDFAVATRTAAERPALLPLPSLLSFVQEKVNVGDRHRRQGEVALLLGRTTDANGHFNRAASEYRDGDREARELGEQYLQLQQMVMDIPYILHWLGADPPGREGRAADVKKVSDFLVNLKTFQAEPDRDGLRLLASQAGDIRAQAEDYAENAWQRTQWRQSFAALKLPFLKPDLRRRIVTALMEQEDGSPFSKDARSHALPRTDRPANPYPLADFFNLFRNAQAISRLLERSHLEPGQSNAMTLAELIDDEQKRALRVQASTLVREMLQRFRNRYRGESEGSNPWELEIRHRLLSAFRASVAFDPLPDDVLLKGLYEQSLSGQLTWQIGRLATDTASMPSRYGYCARTVHDLTNYMREMLDPNFQDPRQRTLFEVEGDGKLVVQGQEPTNKSLFLRARQEVLADQATLCLEWNPDVMSLELENAQTGSGQARWSLPAMAPERPLELKLRFAQRSAGDAALSARVERSDGSIDWLAIQVLFKAAAVAPAELLVTWNEQGGQQNRLEIYPNQEHPVTIAVRKNVAEPLALRVELDGGAGVPGIFPMPTAENQTGTIPLPVTGDVEVPIKGESLQVKLYLGDRLLDRQELRIDILDPSHFLRPSVQYDPQTRMVTARVQRIGRADSNQPIPFVLDLAEMEIRQGNNVIDMRKANNDLVVLDARVPQDESDEDFVATISASGVPRAFRFACSSRRPQGTRVRGLALEIVTPSDRSKFRFDPKRKEIPVTVHADGSDASRLRLDVGIDSNQNGRLDPGEPRAQGEYISGRDVQVWLHATPKALAVRSRVTDITLPIKASSRGRLQIVAELASGGQKMTDSAEVFFLTEAPGISVLQPKNGAQLEIGEPLEVVVVGETGFAAAVDNVRFGFDGNQNGKLDDAEAVVPLNVLPGKDLRFGKENDLKVSLPSKGLEPGRAVLMVQAQTRVQPPEPGGKVEIMTDPGHQRALQLFKPAVAKPEPTKPSPPQFGTIRGAVLIGTVPKKGATVKVAGVGDTRSGNGGTFLFEKVPPGEYQVYAESYQRAGQSAVTVKAGQEAKVDVVLQLK